ncbi:DUF938 domain-containing protein [Cereibacter sphaeroides]|uniref:DUF938 domain-containing protein n=1 Tax=Cereibacter sphaeroides TaxID=1063 RepID=UPI001F37733C|nr:DUF938 domain-containing protein [Cereibacter sphaeroides]MCE6959743.1 DUF938 domain-containing protein [Cereibacter sphaeroides]MCE6968789.1 DUF938 domain-containing protein [Cereibacter sphaeroides]MCE6974597.1 DUF938 domain-containing protein [Cereibacter sphaeroides]
MSLRLPDSDAPESPDGRRHAPSAERNAEAILAVLQAEAPKGRLLEIASGTGQHAARFARALPALDWQPSDLDPGNLRSIAAWRAHAAAPNLRAPIVLDAARPGWSADHRADAILIVNLLHLIPEPAAATVLAEAAAALLPCGRLFLYGPFLRDGRATSEGDAAFDASLRAQDPDVGYKDSRWVEERLAAAGLVSRWTSMPANNLMLVARRT